MYGTHTVGQFRYTYLIMFVPAYMAVFLRHARQRALFFKIFVAFSVGGALLAAPVIGQIKGWSVGPASRFFPSTVSLGLAFGWVALLLACERRAIRFPKWLARLLGVPVVALVLADSHRSVWLSTFIFVVYLMAVGTMSSAVRMRIVTATVAVVSLVVVAAVALGFDVGGYVGQRGNALINPSADPTSLWRLQLWSSNLVQWRQNVWSGVGFGPYYAGNASEGVSAKLMPHSLWIQTLVSIGAVGLALLLAVLVAAAATLWRAMASRRGEDRGRVDGLVVELALGVLISSLAYWSVYSFEFYSALWIGVGLAAAIAVDARRAAGEAA
jgi:O-antigen ligase